MDSGTVFILLIMCLALYDMYKLQVGYPTREEVSGKDHMLFNPSKWRKEQRIILITSTITILCLILGSLFYIMFGNKLIESMYKGESIELLNRLLIYRPNKSLEDYFYFGRIIYSRLVLICVAMQLIIVAFILRYQIFSLVKNFFAAATHPINLAVFRIVFFWTLLDPERVPNTIFYSQLPVELQVVPQGLGWLFTYSPINETLAKVFSNLYLVTCFTGMIGLWSRTSALLTAVFGFYILGIPQIFGKVNHYHHIIWFSALLAASPCGDAFSCDAIFSAWKRADRGITSPPSSSSAYAVPLRFVQLLLGIIYFFPGFWKIWGGGLDWVFSENLKFQMYDKWLESGKWMPFFRLDHHPLMYKFSALVTVIIELSFIFLIFLPRLYVLAPLGGFIFHHMAGMFMNLRFDLYYYYTIFFDLHAIFIRLGRWMYNKDMYLIYDGSGKLCRRTIASIRVFDILERVTYIEVQDAAAQATHGLSWLDSTALMVDMHAIVQRKRYIGFSAYRTLAARIPILWPVLPFLYIWPVPPMARCIYRRVADSRACSIAERSSPTPKRSAQRTPQSAYAAVTIGVALIVGNFFYGITNEGYSWPFACYPTFAGVIREPETESIEISVLSSTGEPIPIDEGPPSRKFTPTRWRGLVGQILSTHDPAQRALRFKALWRVWVQSNPSLQQAEAIRFYKLTLTTIPERRKENPLKRELILELKP
jgi:predicted DCC family thiol-disulfide oxidoreductase YuxK